MKSRTAGALLAAVVCTISPAAAKAPEKSPDTVIVVVVPVIAEKPCKGGKYLVNEGRCETRAEREARYKQTEDFVKQWSKKSQTEAAERERAAVESIARMKAEEAERARKSEEYLERLRRGE